MNPNAKGAITYANSDPGLRQHMPKALREMRPVAAPFNEAVRGTSAPPQRREDTRTDAQTGRGSEMVKKDRPHPELRPKYETQPKRDAFNQAWLKEARAARMAGYEAQRAQRAASPERAPRTPARSLGPEP